MSSYAAEILNQIATDLNKPSSSVEKFINILEENWFDSKESL
jgi:hypothetical protein